MTFFLPQRKADDFVEWLGVWPPGEKTATVKKSLVLAGKLHHAVYMIRSGLNVVRWLMQLTEVHINRSN